MAGQEAEMSHIELRTGATQGHGIPRGWIIVGAALASWLIVAAVWVGTTQLLGFVGIA